jgi:hypothetical protein
MSRSPTRRSNPRRNSAAEPTTTKRTPSAASIAANNTGPGRSEARRYPIRATVPGAWPPPSCPRSASPYVVAATDARTFPIPPEAVILEAAKIGVMRPLSGHRRQFGRRQNVVLQPVGTQPRQDRLKPVASAEDLGDGSACKLLVLLTAAAGDADSPDDCAVERDAHTTFEADQLRVVEVVDAGDHAAHPLPENS